MYFLSHPLIHHPKLSPMKAEPILDSQEIQLRIEAIAQAILKAEPQLPLALVGIHRRGIPLAERLHQLLQSKLADTVLGRIDVSLYRDDLSSLNVVPKLVGSEIDFDLEGRHVILCDEVIQTGRTTRAALEELLDHGRPDKVEIAVLIDRPHRELPLHANYVGERIDASPEKRIQVHFVEVDGEDAVYLQAPSQP